MLLKKIFKKKIKIRGSPGSLNPGLFPQPLPNPLLAKERALM